MRNFLLFIVLFVSGTLFAKDRLAKVENMSGLDVYVMNQPIAKYKIVVRMKPMSLANLNVKSVVTSGVFRETSSDKINQYVNQVLRQAEKQEVQVDAMIYSGGKGAIGIVYLEDENRGLAKVKAIQGIDVYAFCQPNEDFNVLDEKRATSGFWVANITYGIVDSSIDRDMMKLVKRIKRNERKHGTTATIYNGGKKGVGIVYKS